jgi:RNA polymerase-interacting CarD/CdnL/TRCF family regulator
MQFKAGDRIVHPTYGVSEVMRLEERQLAEVNKRLYYVLSADKSTVWVPVDASGLRKLTTSTELERGRALLRGKPASLTTDHRERRLTISESLKSGSFQTLCEVVRDLAAFGWRKSLGEADAALLKRARESLSREWAASAGTTIDEANAEVTALLLKARQTYHS